MTRPTRRLPVLVLLVAVLAAALPAVALAASDPGAGSASLAAIDQERAARGLPALRRAADLTEVARRHSVRMAEEGSLHHNPGLGSEVSGWRTLGENVGRGPDAGAVHRSFMASPAHRDNILGASWVEVGVGVERRGDVVWVTQIFRVPDRQPAAQPTGEPSPAPTPTHPPTPAPVPATAATAPRETPTPTARPAAGPVTTATASPIVPVPAPAPDRLTTMLASLDELP